MHLAIFLGEYPITAQFFGIWNVEIYWFSLGEWIPTFKTVYEMIFKEISQENPKCMNEAYCKHDQIAMEYKVTLSKLNGIILGMHEVYFSWLIHAK